MKFAVTILVIASLSGVAALGFMLMGNHPHGSALHDCLAALGVVQPGACPSIANLADFLEYHVGAFEAYSTAVVSVLLVLVGIALVFRRSIEDLLLGRIFRLEIVRLSLAHTSSRLDLLRWQAILRRSDPSLS